MATAMKLPQCCVCGTSFTYGGSDPRLLPCLHSVCQECLNIGTSDILTCDICQETFDKEQTDFPPDVVAIKDIFLQTAEYDGSAVLCTNKDDGNQAMSWCDECEALLCEHCQAGHEDMKITRSHKVVPLENLKSSDGVPIPKTAYCTEHVDHPLQLYDDTCEQRICFKCRENHGVCKVNDITEAYQHLKETVLDEERKASRRRLRPSAPSGNRYIQLSNCQRRKKRKRKIS
ncbi:transcription intermediary factor 1-beta-like [Haliotis rubra]|uniref:transcription intermediary factor 1-beta-like n=1 Tax=Haliotis rubra TaxID=36100 RepID=UPI001EE5229F|nr:transcription intermediary factor 1-beta-like [Haliotis rubra]